MNHDPRQTMFVIESVDTVLREWTTVFSLAEERTRECIATAAQSVEAFAGRTRGLLAETETHQQTAAESMEMAVTARTEALECKSSADRTVSEANTASQQASAMVHTWHAALVQARSHLAHVRQQLAEAVQGLRGAESFYAQARSEVHAAEMALMSCQNSYVTDSKGRRVTPDCSSQHFRLISAQSRLSTAHGAVVQWQGHVGHWQDQDSRAQSRVEHRQAGVARATDARNMAEAALLAAGSAERFARDGVNWAESAAVGADKVMTLASETRAMAEAAVLLGKSAQDNADVMDRGGRRMADVVAEHVNHSGRAGNLLNDAFDALREFDRPGSL